MGLEVRTGVAHTGVVGLLRGGEPGAVVAWRSDIDALPIAEQVDVPWKSTNPGVMHACGHDVHLTVGLGAAAVLAALRAEVPGTVTFIFQLAEAAIGVGVQAAAALLVSAASTGR